jgi:hypothetical protein
MKSRAAEIILYALVILLSLGALWLSVSTPSFSMDNKAVYQGF